MADPRPSPEQLWRQAGGGTDRYDRDRFRALLREHRHLVPLQPGEKAEPLPCGWPAKRVADQRCELTELLIGECSHCRQLDDWGRDMAKPGPVFTAAYRSDCAACGDDIEPGYAHASCVDGE